MIFPPTASHVLDLWNFTIGEMSYQSRLLYTTGAAVVTGALYILYAYGRNLQNPPRAKPESIDYPDIISSVRKVKNPADGREIGFAIYGEMSSSSKTVVFFHGLPGSRLVPSSGLKDLCTKAGIQFIAIDRPGIGLTSPTADRQSTFDVSPTDVDFVLKECSLPTDGKVIVVGYSIGGPHAMKYVLDYPDNVSRLCLIAPAGFYIPHDGFKPGKEWDKVLEGYDMENEDIAPSNRNAQVIVRNAPWFLSFHWTTWAHVLVDAKNYLKGMLRATSNADEQKLSKDDKALLIKSTAETFRQGVAGFLRETIEIFGKQSPDGWGWDVRGIKEKAEQHGIETTLYASKNDVLAPFSRIVEVAQLIGTNPDNFKVVEGGFGHLSILKEAFDDLLQ